MIIYRPNGQVLIDVPLERESFQESAVMSSPKMVLKFVLGEYLEIPLMSYAEWRGQRYLLWRASDITKQSSREYHYSVSLFGYAEMLKGIKYKLLSDADRSAKVKFPLVGKPILFLEVLVANLNKVDSGWRLGSVLDATEKTIAFNHEDCYSALGRLAEEFKTEWHIDGKTISLGKISSNEGAPILLSYGKGNGVKAGMEIVSDGDKLPIGRLYVQGGERNIDPSTYGVRTLLLPKSASLDYKGEIYRTDSKGEYVYLSDVTVGRREDSYDGTEIHPKRIGAISRVETIPKKDDAGKSYLDYDIIDSSIPASLDYSKCRIAGEKAFITFQSGKLAGQSFDIEASNDILSGYIHSDRRFRLVRSERDGYMMPEPTTFYPSVGDKYIVFGVSMPSAYISDDATKTGASWDMFREAVKYFHEERKPKVSYNAELDGIYAQRNWGAIGAKLVVGGYVRLTDAPMGVDELIRITSIRTDLDAPYKPKITLSNSVVSSSISSSLAKLEAEQVVRRYEANEDKEDLRRSLASALRAAKDLEGVLGNRFDSRISPLAIHTMQLIAGDPSLQFVFVESKTSTKRVRHVVNYDADREILTIQSGVIRHLSIGVSVVSAPRSPQDYKHWSIPKLDYAVRNDEGLLYVYAKCSKTSDVGQFIVSSAAKGLEEDAGYYNLLLGMLSSKPRVFTPLYGFSELLPGRITTDRIVSQDGRTYFDLVKGEIGGRIVFGNEPLEEKIRELEQTSRSQRQHIRYSPYPNGREYGEPSGTPRMYTIPQDSSYMGILISYDDVASSNPDDYTWLLFKGRDGVNGAPGRDGLPGRDGEDGVGIKGDDGVGVESVRPQYQVLSRPDASTAIESRWADDYPRWVEGRYLAVRMRVQYTSGSVRYSTPYISNEWEALSEVRELDHIKRAIKGKTMVEGGLMITRMVGVASNDEYIKDPTDKGKKSVTAYINGDSNHIATDSYAVDRASVARHIAFAAGVTDFGTGAERRSVEIDHSGNARFGSFAIERDDSGESVAYFLDPKTPAYNTPLLRVGGGQLPLQDLISSSGHTDSTYIRRGTSRTINMSMGIQSVTQLSEEMQAQGWIAIRDGATLEIKGDLHLQVTISDYFGTCTDGSDARDCLTPKVIVSADMVIGQTTVHVMNKIYDYDGSRVYENKTYSLNRKLIGLPSSNYETPKLIVKAQIYRFKPASQSDANLNLQVIATATNTSDSYGGVDIKTYTTNDAKQSVLSSNGLSFFWGRNRFAYISNRPNDPVLSVRGKTDIYGALAHGVVEANVGNAAYRCVRYGGCYVSADGTAPSVGAPRLGTAEVSHNVGHTNYCVSIVPLGEARVSFSVSATQSSSFKVHFWNEQGTLVRVPFMYTILGTNYSE